MGTEQLAHLCLVRVIRERPARKMYLRIIFVCTCWWRLVISAESLGLGLDQPIRYAGINEVLFYTICCHLVPLHRLNDMCDALCSFREMRQVREVPATKTIWAAKHQERHFATKRC
uniref:Uncharacterized protein n=1 Tax=Trichuris muris TaxID=70415 RepID=A0A5S6QSY7_TRIMR